MTGIKSAEIFIWAPDATLLDILHFDNVLNCPSSFNDEAIAPMPQVETDYNLEMPATEEEVKKTIKQMA